MSKEYHRKLGENERAIFVDLGNNKFANLLFVKSNNQIWSCNMDTQTMEDLENLYTVVEK